MFRSAASKSVLNQRYDRSLSRLNQALLLRSREPLIVVGFLALIFVTFLVRLSSVVTSDPQDEGTYLYASKLVSEGFTPYRDFFLAHPPLMVYVFAGWEYLFGPDVMAARIVYIMIIMASLAPLYMITRVLSGSRLAGLLSIAIYTTGMVIIGNQGRTIKLDPFMSAFLIAAAACLLLRPDNVRFRVLAGVLFAGAMLVKLVAVVPVGLLLLGDLCWVRPNRQLVRTWVATAIGGVIVLLPAAALLMSQPHVLDDVVRSQFNRPGLTLSAKLVYVRQDFMRYPLIPLALVIGAWVAARSRDGRLRAVAMVAVGSTAHFVLVIKVFIASHIIPVLPWVGVLIGVTAAAAARRIAPGWWKPLFLAGTLAVAVSPALYSELYYRTSEGHTSSPASVVALLKRGDGDLYTMNPIFALWSGRRLHSWYYVADSYLARSNGEIGDDDFLAVLSQSQSLVLFAGELNRYPKSRAYAESHFTVAFEDSHNLLLVRADSTN